MKKYSWIVFIITIIAMLPLESSFAKKTPGKKEETSGFGCNVNTLNTTTGPANMEAQWTANTINLDWFDGDSKLTVDSTSATCSYDGAITLPSTPNAPTGYSFGGWQIRTWFNLNTLANNINITGINTGHIELNNASTYNKSKYGLTNSGEWVVEFEYGIIKGTSKCTAVGDCSCKALLYDATKDGRFLYVENPLWVYLNSGDGEDCVGECIYCTDNCAQDCSVGVSYDSNFRSTLYGINQ